MLNFILLLSKDKLINMFFTNFYYFFYIKFFLFNILHFRKIIKLNFKIVRHFSYTGKIFRLKFFKKKIKFFFNRRHRTFLYFNKTIFVQKIAKKLFKLSFVFKKDFFYFKGAYKRVRGLNIFT